MPTPSEGPAADGRQVSGKGGVVAGSGGGGGQRPRTLRQAIISAVPSAKSSSEDFGDNFFPLAGCDKSPWAAFLPPAATAETGAADAYGWAVKLLLLAALLVVASLAPRGVAADDAPPGGRVDLARFRDHLAAIADGSSRGIGSDGYKHAQRYLQSVFDALPNGVQVRRHRYPVMTPVTRSATLTFGAGDSAEKFDVFPLWPAKIRLNTTPGGGIDARIVYCGNATAQQIRPRSVEGAIAVVEATAGQGWTQPFFYGAKAVIVLGSPDVTWQDLQSQELRIPADLPRVFVPDGPLAERLRRPTQPGSEPTAVLLVSADWVEREATNYYAFVPGTEGPSATEEGLPPAAMTVEAGYDTAGLVPDQAPGAGQAVQVAAALAMLESYAKSPAPRPTLFVFSGADAMSLIGTREMMMALGDPPQTWNDAANEVGDLLATDKAQRRRLEQIALDPTKLERRGDRDLLARLNKVAEAEATDVQGTLFRLRLKGRAERTPADAAQERALQDRLVELGTVRNSLKNDPASLAAAPEQLREAEQYVRTLYDRLAGDATAGGLIADREAYLARLDDRRQLYQWLAKLVGRPPDPDPRSSESRPIELMVGLDLSGGGLALGPLNYGTWTGANNNALVQPLRDWFASARRDANGWLASYGGRLDFDTFGDPRWKLAAPLAFPTELAAAWGVPSLTLATLNDERPRRDTPLDTVEHLDLPRIEQHLLAADETLRRAWHDPKFVAGGAFLRRTKSIEGQVLSLASGKPVPDLPRPGFLATYYYAQTAVPRPIYTVAAQWTLGVRRTEIVKCDAEGRYRFEGFDQLGDRQLRLRSVQVYKLAPGTGEIDACTDTGRGAEGVATGVDLQEGTIRPIKSLVFDCEEFSLVGLYDPRFLQKLGDVQLMDARRNTEPQKYNLSLWDGMMAGFVEPGTRNYLLFRYGRVGNRLILLNVPGSDDDTPGATAAKPAENGPKVGDAGDVPLVTDTAQTARGFTVEQLRNLGPLSMRTARDFYNLDDRRLTNYRDAGVSSGLLDGLHEQAGTQLKDAGVSYQQNSGGAFLRNATGAWATEALVYGAAQDMANDVVRAAVFLLLLCVPFAFCMERLLIATPNVYRQIGGAMSIFSVMAAALWLFHPAFRITNSALIIILAFAILFMSGLVIWVIYSRFDSELKKVRSGRGGPMDGGAVGATFARASVLAQAVTLGIANMRRRKFRTLLTSTTIVLITFAVLCFTSSTTYTSVSSLSTGTTSEYPGVMLRQRGFRAVPTDLLESLAAVFPDRQIVERWWNLSDADENFKLFVESGETGDVRTLAQRGALGISPGEDTLTPLSQVVGADAAARLQNTAERVVCLSRPAAEALKVKVGDVVRVAGIKLFVIGLFEPDVFDARMTALSGEPISPLDASAGVLDASGGRLADTSADTLSVDAATAGAEADAVYEHLSGGDFFLVPAAISKLLPQASLRTVSIRLPDQPAVDAAVNELTRRYALATFAAYDDGVRLVAATQPTSVAGAAVAIPLAIGGLIIFNTMMGSIAERRKEIHVYTSLGLAPVHVGALFVAEALTYGLIGAVFGYVIGQLVGTVLQNLGWLGGATLNYSGTSAMLTMGLILLVVLLSALVPARIASKIAAPSIDRNWRVPEPENGVIFARLPFTINQTAAAGALAYLAEFFDAHTDGTIGKFSSGRHRAVSQNGRRGRAGERAAGQHLADAVRFGRAAGVRGRDPARRDRGRLRGRREPHAGQRRRRFLAPHEPHVPDAAAAAVPGVAEPVAAADAGLHRAEQGHVPPAADRPAGGARRGGDGLTTALTAARPAGQFSAEATANLRF